MANDEWYTPPEIIEPVRAALGGIDLDPCSTRAAQDTVRATEYYALPDNDGLILPWFGRVWLNPPYSAPKPWVFRLLETDNSPSACILTATSMCGSEAGLLLLDLASVIAFPGRGRFRRGDGSKGDAPRDASVIVFIGEPVDTKPLNDARWKWHRVRTWRNTHGGAWRSPVKLEA